MCGLVGMMGALDVKHRDVMKELLFLDTLRGMDSTGVASVRRDRKVETRKMTVPGYDFINMAFIPSLMGFGDQLWLGHNRFKTRGLVNRLNAHPFEVVNDRGYIDLIGAHNGTLNNQDEIEKLLEGNPKFGTDSEALINLINEVGAEDAIKEAEGAWSLVWWDAPENTLNFLRNDKRPMYYAYTKDRKVLIWASEVWMILAACNRNGVELQTSDKGIACFSTTVDTLYTFKIPQDKTEIAPPEKKGGLLGKPEKAPFRGTTGGYYGGYSGNSRLWEEHDKASKSEGKKETPKATTTTGQTGTVIQLPGHTIRGYNGKWITPKERDTIADKGCGWCGGPLDGRGMAYLDENTGCCSTCVGGGHQISITPPRKVLGVKKG